MLRMSEWDYLTSNFEKASSRERVSLGSRSDACIKSFLLECLPSVVFSVVLAELRCNMRAVRCLHWLSERM